MVDQAVPVVTIDGPSGVGKGTLSRLLIEATGWHLLDSGAIYRAFAWYVMHTDTPLEDEPALLALVPRLRLRFTHSAAVPMTHVWCDDRDITQFIREEACGMMASKLAVLPSVRQALLACQREMAVAPGLIADGRDMGTVVFPEAPCQFFLTASVDVRAERRYQQLLGAGQAVDRDSIHQALAARDRRDVSRSVAPLRPSLSATVIDTTDQTIEAVCSLMMQQMKSTWPTLLSNIA